MRDAGRTLDGALSAVAKAAILHRPGLVCLVRLADDRTNGYRLAAVAGPGRWPQVIPFGTAPTNDAAERPLARRGVLRPGRRRTGRTLGYYGVPLDGGGSRGVLEFFRLDGQTPTVTERSRVNALARVADTALAVWSRASLSTTRSTAADSLADVARIFARSLDLQAVSERIVEAVRALLDTRLAVLYRRESVPPHDVVVLAVAGTRLNVLRPGVTLPAGTGIVGLAIRERRAMTTSNMFEDPRIIPVSEAARAALRAGNLPAALSVPLMIQGRVTGGLTCADPTGRTYPPDQIRLVEAFADHAAIALENLRLYEERRQRLYRLIRLNGVIASSLDPGRVYEEIVQAAAELMDARPVELYGFDERRGRLPRLATSHPGLLDARSEERALGEVFVGRAALERRTFVIERIADHDEEFAQALLARGIVSAVIMPIVHGDTLLGVLALGWSRPLQFEREDEELLQSFVAQAAVATHNARLYQELSQERSETVELARAAGLFTETLEIGSVAQTVVEQIVKLFGVRSAILWRFDPAGRAVAVAVAGRVSELVSPGGVSEVSPLVTRVAMDDVLAQASLPIDQAQRDWCQRTGQRAAAFIPLRRGGASIGSLAVFDSLGRRFSESDLARLQTFADQAAMAVANADLYEAARRGRREAEILAEVASTINRSLDLDVVLQSVVERARELCESQLARIALREPGTDEFRFRYWVGSRSSDYGIVRVKPGQGLGGLALATGLPARTDDWEADSRITKELRSIAHAENIRAEMVVPIVIADRIEGLAYVDRRQPRPFTERDEALLVRLAAHAAVAIGNASLYARTVRLSRQLVEAQEAERRAIAHELHDQIGQDLTAVKLLLRRAERTDGAARRESLEDALILVDELIERARGLSLDLRPATLDDLGLVAALDAFLRQYRKRTGVLVELEHDGNPRRLAPRTETAAFRIVQEALTNVARHAETTTAHVRLSWRERLGVEVEDRGRGFDPAVANGALTAGLSGMRDRAGWLGGRFEIHSTPHQGTRVLAELPAEPPAP